MPLFPYLPDYRTLKTVVSLVTATSTGFKINYSVTD